MESTVQKSCWGVTARAVIGFGAVLVIAYLFGGITILQFHVQIEGYGIPPQFVSMLPYVTTIIVLCIISTDRARIRLNAPACLGKPFHAAG